MTTHARSVTHSCVIPENRKKSDSSHVVAMATAPPGRRSARQHTFVFRKLAPIMWFCLSDENTSLALPVSLAQGRSTGRHVSAESHTSLTKEYKQVYGIKHPYN